MKEKYSRVLVLGGGKTGASLCRYFVRMGCQISVYDTRPEPPEIKTIKSLSSDIRFITCEPSTEHLQQFDIVAVSPGVSMHDSVVIRAEKCGLEVIGDLELFYRGHQEARIIAITGSNGKSTVTALIHGILLEAGVRAEIGGNFGTPVLDLDSNAEAYVLEISSFQLEMIRNFSCEIGIVLNISPDHLDRYRDFEEYRMIKEKLYLHADIPVINQDDDKMKEHETPYSISYTTDVPEDDQIGLRDVEGETWICHGEKKILPIHEIRLVGQHNIFNVMAAAAASLAFGIEYSIIRKTVGTFIGLPHRVEEVCRENARYWVDDSKGTNVGASEAAIRGVNGRVLLIAGGIAKETDYSLLAKAMQSKGRMAILIGRDAPILGKALAGIIPVVYADDMLDAVMIAFRFSEPGDTVLLSPACASFDMFENYMERGQAFRKAVELMLSQHISKT